MTIAANEEGIAVVSLGRKWMIAIVKATSPNMRSNSFCGSQVMTPLRSGALNWPS
ncbi:Uncharacterised protein [Vibrio cholerae]|nr:Uncharacterised protein [Vibrio cholerae]